MSRECQTCEGLDAARVWRGFLGADNDLDAALAPFTDSANEYTAGQMT